jgi:hypothetical protein
MKRPVYACVRACGNVTEGTTRHTSLMSLKALYKLYSNKGTLNKNYHSVASDSRIGCLISI